ncbi:hypothetical protein EON66_11010, partial [archaeon]
MCAQQLGQLSDAVADLYFLVRNEPNKPAAFDELAQLCMRQGHFELAQTLLNAIVDKLPYSSYPPYRIFLQRALADMFKGRYTSAYSNAQLAIALAPLSNPIDLK